MADMWKQYANNDDFADDVADAIAETDQEIFWSAFDEQPPENNYDDSMEQVESWDGEPLSEDDMLEGPNENGYDRPASLRRDQDLMVSNEQLRQQLADRESQLDQLQNGPERQEQFRQQAREMLYQQYGILPTDDRVDGLINQLAAQQASVQKMQNDRFNQSMAVAHREYGNDFERTFDSFRNMDPNSPAARALAQEVYNAPNPGARLMSLQHGGTSSLGRGGADMAALGLYGARTAPASRGGGRDLAHEDSGFGRDDVEMDIFRSAWDN